MDYILIKLFKALAKLRMILNFLIDETPLFYACLNKNTDIVQILLDNSANIFIKDTESKTPLDLAVEAEYEDIVDLFVSHCVQVIIITGCPDQISRDSFGVVRNRAIKYIFS